MPEIPLYDRELSWIDFNIRILAEAEEISNPPLERVRFLSITASNLDEFFMVRAKNVLLSDENSTKAKLLCAKLHDFMKKQYRVLNRSIITMLRKENIQILSAKELSIKQRESIDSYFESVISALLTPRAVDKSHPFPSIKNKAINLVVKLKKENTDFFAIVSMPSGLPRLFGLPIEKGRAFISLENILISKLSEIFKDCNVLAHSVFRVTCDSGLKIDEDNDEDILETVEKSIQKNSKGKLVRLEVQRNCRGNIKSFLMKHLKADLRDVYEQDGMLDLSLFEEFINKFEDTKLFFKPFDPIIPAFLNKRDIFSAIREQDRILHHPYESFNAVYEFIKQAAEDINVLSIKQTLYRLSDKSPIVKELCKASKSGKEVTVVIELKARFDEKNNVKLAKKLEKAGCNVVYGIPELKTHCKICMVVRNEDDGIRRYVHVSTGNYNEKTARIYADIGLFTCNEKFAKDATMLFNYLTGYAIDSDYNEFIVSPYNTRKFLKKAIENEIENQKTGNTSGIIIKVNSLTDEKIIEQLYKASQAGVRIDLYVRGACCLIPELTEVSENIRVFSIVGRFLEHSRIFYFQNGGSPNIYLGSADLMPRNMDKRVELLFPILNVEIQNK
ncbi:MAG: polyphosphate kinase 1, partial [Bacillota bacterium]|nr:polyphosphate kinase 1 [Bacillota bacterium]